MREVIVKAWCDACDDEGKREASAGPMRVAFGTAALREVDLCSVHAAALVEPLLALLEAHGLEVDSKGKPLEHRHGQRPAGPRNRPCPECGRSYASHSGLYRHLAVDHPDRAAVSEWVCADCGREFTRPQSLASHRRMHESA